MATTAETVERINIMLRELTNEADSLPEMAALWPELSLGSRDSYYLEWRNLMGGLRALHDDFSAGTMTTVQQAHYRHLVERLKSLIPIMEHLNLNTPPVAPEG